MCRRAPPIVVGGGKKNPSGGGGGGGGGVLGFLRGGGGGGVSSTMKIFVSKVSTPVSEMLIIFKQCVWFVYKSRIHITIV